MRTFKPRMEILPEAQRRLWPELRPATDLGLVLYGGTALALRLGHRASVDFDFFTQAPLDKSLLRERLPFLNDCTVLQDEANAYTVETLPDSPTGSAVKLSFFGTIEFGRAGEPERTADGVLEVASLQDLLATKLKVIFQRVEAKDYQDVAAILRSGTPLEEGLASARELFGNVFSPQECLRTLTYFEGGDLETLNEEDRQTLRDRTAHVKELPDVRVLSKTLSLSGEAPNEMPDRKFYQASDKDYDDELDDDLDLGR